MLSLNLIRKLSYHAHFQQLMCFSLMNRFQHYPCVKSFHKGCQLPSDFLRTAGVIATGQRTMATKMDNLLNDPRRHFDYETLISKKKDGAMLIVDVRQPEEIVATGAIPDSINIPLTEVEDALVGTTPEAFRMKYGADKPSKGTLIVFSCQSGRRSVTALGKALFHGYLNAGNYKGGWLDWESHTKQQ